MVIMEIMKYQFLGFREQYELQTDLQAPIPLML